MRRISKDITKRNEIACSSTSYTLFVFYGLILMIRRGQIPSINIGTRLTRINRKDLEKMFVKRPIAKHIKETPLPKKYSLEPEDCYTIGEVCEKYHINDSSVWAHVRKYSIPSRQIGNYVYVPKEEIDNLYKSETK